MLRIKEGNQMEPMGLIAAFLLIFVAVTKDPDPK
jgi:hypothetical protein